MFGYKLMLYCSCFDSDLIDAVRIRMMVFQRIQTWRVSFWQITLARISDLLQSHGATRVAFLVPVGQHCQNMISIREIVTNLPISSGHLKPAGRLLTLPHFFVRDFAIFPYDQSQYPLPDDDKIELLVRLGNQSSGRGQRSYRFGQFLEYKGETGLGPGFSLFGVP
jgi:hypothetical protein